MATEFTNPQINRPAVTSTTPEGRRFEITKRAGFEAAHFLETAPEGHIYRGVHGHSFQVEATLAGEVKPGENWVEDFAVLTQALNTAAEKLDHTLLNEIDGLKHPTLERLCLWFACQLQPQFPALSKVTLLRPSLNEVCTLVL